MYRKGVVCFTGERVAKEGNQLSMVDCMWETEVTSLETKSGRCNECSGIHHITSVGPCTVVAERAQPKSLSHMQSIVRSRLFISLSTLPHTTFFLAS